jgi:transposase
LAEYRTSGALMIWVTKAITLCRETENVHFCRDADFPEKHMQGIISHAGYNISPGMVEGFNNKIQTMRRKAYGFNDDEYFFLKIIDISK